MPNKNAPEGLSDVKAIRKRARDAILEGPVTPGYGADRDVVVRVLNEALASELVCQLRYQHHYYMATGIRAEVAAAEFLEHANDEALHAEWFARRIIQLGGVPDFNPDTLTARSHADYVATEDLEVMLRENLVAERIAIETYREIVHYLGDRDPTTRRLFEEVLEKEEEHADDLATLLARPHPLPTRGNLRGELRAK
jgi:bacterioferritin